VVWFGAHSDRVLPLLPPLAVCPVPYCLLWLSAPPLLPPQEKFSVQKKLHTLDRLAWSDMFETFLANK
jgi:hypothetical protein